MNPPPYLKEELQFIGVMKYYHHIWERRSYTLAPLTNKLSSKVILNGLKPNKMPSIKLSGLWPTILH